MWGVLDARGDAGLVGEAAPEGFVAGVLGGEQFQGDGAAQAEVGGAVDDGHAAAAEFTLDAVAGDLRSGADHCGRTAHRPGHA
ncbi:hypothetical protein GCM10020256_23530 [Streptomyces thermocoprophilus]